MDRAPKRAAQPFADVQAAMTHMVGALRGRLRRAPKVEG